MVFFFCIGIFVLIFQVPQLVISVSCPYSEFCQFSKYPTYCSDIPIAILYTDGGPLFNKDGSYLSRHRYLSYMNVFGNGTTGVKSCMTQSDLSYSGYVGIKTRGRSTKTLDKSQFSVKTYGSPSTEKLAAARASWTYTNDNGNDTPISSTCVHFNPKFNNVEDCKSYKSRESCECVCVCPASTPTCCSVPGPHPCIWVPNAGANPQDMPKKIDTKLMGLKKGNDWIFHAPGVAEISMVRNHFAYKMARDSGQYASRTQFFELFIVSESGRTLESRVPSLSVPFPASSIHQNDYRGVYILLESPKTVSKNRVDIESFKQDSGFEVERGFAGGYILAYDEPCVYDTPIKNKPPYKEDTPWMGIKLNVAYPNPDDITPTQLIYVQNAIRKWDEIFSQVEQVDSNIDDPLNPSKLVWLQYRDYIDFDSWALYILHMEVSKDQDGYVNSFYMYKDSNKAIGDQCPINEVTLSNNLVINEIVNQPLSGYDWVEFYNRANSTVDLTGWYFTDQSTNNVFRFLDGTKVDSQKYLLIEINSTLLGFGLGTKDQLHLYDNSGNEVDFTEWSTGSKGRSLARCPNGEGTFSEVSVLTPDAENNCAIADLPACVDPPATDFYGSSLPKGRFSKWKAGPVWDYNMAYGNLGPRVPTNKEENHKNWLFKTGRGHYWVKLTTDPIFVDHLVRKWTEMRRTVWNTTSLTNIIDINLFQLLYKSIDMEAKSNALIINKNEWWKDVQNLKDFITRRVTWMDENICSLYSQQYVANSVDSLNPSHPNQVDSLCTLCNKGDCVCGLCVCYEGWMGEGCQYSINTPPAAPNVPTLTSFTSRSLTLSWSLPDAFGTTITHSELMLRWTHLGESHQQSAGTFKLTTTATLKELLSNKTYFVSIRCKNAYDVWGEYSIQQPLKTGPPPHPTVVIPAIIQANQPTSVEFIGAEAEDMLAVLDKDCKVLHELTLSGSSTQLNLANGIYQFCYKPVRMIYKNLNGVELRSIDDSAVVHKTNGAVAQDSDDVEEQGTLDNSGLWTGTQTLIGSSDLEIGNDGAMHQQVGIRIPSISFSTGVDQSISITNAKLEFLSKITHNMPVTAVIHGLMDSTTFSGTNNDDVSRRSKTSASVTWDIPAWEIGNIYNSPDISVIIQEMIDDDAWSNGQALAFSITTKCTYCTRTAWAYSSGKTAPVLNVDYWLLNASPLFTKCTCPDGSEDGVVYGQLRINELMAKNDGTIADPSDGNYDDWVEIYNAGSQPEALGLYYLTDDAVDNPTKYRLPNETLAPGEWKIIWMDGADIIGPDHAPFKLSSKGESLSLFDYTLRIFDEVTFSRIGTNQAFGRFPDGTGNFSLILPTPGSANRQFEVPSDPTGNNNISFGHIVINEFMASNKKTIKDPDSNSFDDWLEIYNNGTESEQLNHYSLSDGKTKWQFPPGLLTAGERVLVWMDSTSYSTPNGLHASFSLSKSGEELFLIWNLNNKILDNATYGSGILIEDEALGRYPDGVGSFVYVQPTPNEANVPFGGIPTSSPTSDLESKNIFPVSDLSSTGNSEDLSSAYSIKIQNIMMVMWFPFMLPLYT